MDNVAGGAVRGNIGSLARNLSGVSRTSIAANRPSVGRLVGQGESFTTYRDANNPNQVIKFFTAKNSAKKDTEFNALKKGYKVFEEGIIIEAWNSKNQTKRYTVKLAKTDFSHEDKGIIFQEFVPGITAEALEKKGFVGGDRELELSILNQIENFRWLEGPENESYDIHLKNIKVNYDNDTGEYSINVMDW